MIRFLWVPASLRQVQVWQMPIRQPNAGGDAGLLGLLEQRGAAVRHLDRRAGEADGALAGLADRRQVGRHEALDVEPRLEAVRPGPPDRVEQRRRAAGEGLGLGEAGLGLGKVTRAEVPVELAGAGGAGVGAEQPEAGVLRRQALQLLAVDRAGGVGGVVEQGDGPVVALREEGAEDRHQRGDAAAAADQQDRVGPRPRQLEVAFGGGEAEHHPRLGAVREEVGDEALGVPLDRDLQLRAPSLGRGGRVAAPVPGPVDLDRHLDELARPEALPGAVRAQGQGDALLGPALDRDHLGPALAGDEEGVDLFEVAVDPVRPGERVEQAEAGDGRASDA